MAKNKIQRNSICPLCKSGLKYKKCCGKGQPVYPTSARWITTKLNPSDFDKEVYSALNQYPDEYINPIKKLTDVYYVLVDESNIKDDYTIGGIVVLKSEVENNISIRTELLKLVEDYGIDHIHFTDIFGKRILGERRDSFLEKYVSLIKPLNLVPFAVSMTDEEVKKYVKIDPSTRVTKDQLYIALTHKLMFNVLTYLTYLHLDDAEEMNLIIELWREQDSITAEKRILHKKNIKGLIGDFPFMYISIFNDCITFTKEDLLFSSIADFVAYSTGSIYPKIKKGAHLKKVERSHYKLLEMFGELFDNSIGMRNEEFGKMVQSVRRTKGHRKL